MCSLLRVGGGRKEQIKPCIHFYTFARTFIIISTSQWRTSRLIVMRVNLILFFCVAHSVLGRNVINVWGKKNPSVAIGHWAYPFEGPPQQGMVFVFLFFPMGRVRHTQKQWSVIKISPKWILWDFQTAEQENGLKKWLWITFKNMYFKNLMHSTMVFYIC